jgi:putative membrane protein
MKGSHFLALLVAFSAVNPSAALAQTASPDRYYVHGPQMMWGDGGWAMFFFGPLFMILVIIAVVAGVVLLARGLGGGLHLGTPPPPSNRALDILKERFARGEIDGAEYEERRKVLGE